MKNSTPNPINKKVSNNPKTASRLKVKLAIIVVLFLALAITVAILVAVFINKANSALDSDSLDNIINFNSANFTSCINDTPGKKCDECGLSFKNPNLKIVGGQEANPNSWPSIGYLVFRYKNKYYLENEGVYVTPSVSGFCGGTLIDRTTFLSAAHCIRTSIEFKYKGKVYSGKIIPNEYYPTYESIYSVYLGLHDTSVINDQNLNSDISPAKRYEVVKIISHEKYNTKTNLNDISIFKLSQPAVLSIFVQLACLPPMKTNNYPVANSKVYAAGWGTLLSNGLVSNRLQNVLITAYAGSACSQYQNTNWNSQICAGELNGGKDTCQGDSGGPLYLKETINGTVRHVLVGITSYGNGCGEAGFPGIYTRVSYYLDWINKNK